MPYDPHKHHRQSIRLDGYDYTRPGAYFVTINTYQKTPFFGEMCDGQVTLSEGGTLAQQCWRNVPTQHPSIALDAFVIMPDHMHGVIVLRRYYQPIIPDHEQRIALGAIIRTYKADVTYQMHQHFGDIIGPIWHRNYYESIIRDTVEFDNVRRYIHENWLRDHPPT